MKTIDPEQLHVLSEQSAREAVVVKATLGNAGSPINAATSALPVWTYQVTAAENRTRYTGLIVGQSLTSSIKTTTTVPVVLIPVVLKITQGGVSYTFPSSTDSGCLGSLNAFSPERRVLEIFGICFEPLPSTAEPIDGIGVDDHRECGYWRQHHGRSLYRERCAMRHEQAHKPAWQAC